MQSKSPYIFNVPESQKNDSVKLWEDKLVIPTYEHATPDKNPMFFEKRVYQGSSGKVYPLPYVDKILDEKVDKEYRGVFLENEYVRFIILPELGGRIQIGQDKTNNNYDFFYRNDVIKPALVGLGGPWISGGVEFNWPQHHRPATYLPVQFTFEEEEDGTKTVWLSDHDPKERMKALLGLSLKPNSSVLEAKVRLYNRTEDTKTFLWWANVAAEVHDDYQSFFPPDVNYVADHAARAMSEFPESKSVYYGIDYAPGTDISMYKNIPVPTSYMVVDTEGEFFGGYDYKADGGFVHVANKHISPGKKQWTWGNEKFGQAWDRNLTDENGPYVELMAGVYTNNQPDFTYLLPGETKEFSQFWYPIQNIGSAQYADTKGALHLSIDNGRVTIGATTTKLEKGCKIELYSKKEIIFSSTEDLAPNNAFTKGLDYTGNPEDLILLVTSPDKHINMGYKYQEQQPISELPEAAKETPDPSEIDTIEELYLAGEHLDQYRHPTRYPEDYWREALNRDPGDIRSNIALGNFYLKRFDPKSGEIHFRKAIERLTAKHPNPVDGEAFYGLGIALKRQGRDKDAYKAFYKATWNFAWRASGYYEVALLDIKNEDYQQAKYHLKLAISHNGENLKAKALMALCERKTGNSLKAISICKEILTIDPLFYLGMNELIEALLHNGDTLEAEKQLSIFLNTINNDELHFTDTAGDYISAGLYSEALDLVNLLVVESKRSTSPYPLYLKAWLESKIDNDYKNLLKEAAGCKANFYFPSTYLEYEVLEWATISNKEDFNSPYYLGTMLYDKKEKERAVNFWLEAETRGSKLSTLYRNLGIAFYNYKNDDKKAIEYYERAFDLEPNDARILFELDQLKKKVNISPESRIDFILKYPENINYRDDLTIELANLFCITNKPEKALELLQNREFHPWEGGEGQVVNVWTISNLMLGEIAEEENNFKKAADHYKAILDLPLNLGESWHPLQNQARIYNKLGEVYNKLGDTKEANRYFTLSKNSKGDFSSMAVQEMSENTYYSASSMVMLDEVVQAKELFNKMIEFGNAQLKKVAKIDYFATSLPLLLVFEDDIQLRSDLNAKYIKALGYYGLNDINRFNELKSEILSSDNCHPIQFFNTKGE